MNDVRGSAGNDALEADGAASISLCHGERCLNFTIVHPLS